MPRIALTGGAYQARSVIAAAQRSLNLMPEPIPPETGEPSRMAHYPTPGLTVLGTLPQNGVRGIRQATTGQIFAVAGDGVFLVNPGSWTGTQLGTITPMRPYPVGMQDDGINMVIVDGTPNGWAVNLSGNTFSQITDPNFYGADRVDFLDTYTLYNRPGTPQFYSSNSEAATTFDPLYFVNKESFSDLLISIAVAKREIWLLGERTTEIWFNAGAPDFPFQEMPGVFIDQGCTAKYSVAVYDNRVLWLARNRAGEGIVVSGAGYLATRISSFAIEEAMRKYPTIDDAIGMTYSLGGHICYVLTFPSADETWSFDIATGQWHEWKWIDNNGLEHRHRANCMYLCNDTVVVGDWENGNLYKLDADNYTDAGQPIKRIRAFPHIVADAHRVFYREFTADLETGTAEAAIPPGVATLLSCSFTAPDGTLLQNYSNDLDTEAIWALVSGPGGEVEANAAAFLTGGTTIYQSIIMSAADYSLSFTVAPNNYTTVPVATLFAIARYNGANTGYRVAIAGDGTLYKLIFDVEGGGYSVTQALGTIPSGAYVVTLQLAGSLISVSVQRSSDDLILGPGGVWGIRALALQVIDSTYPAAGSIVIGATA